MTKNIINGLKTLVLLGVVFMGGQGVLAVTLPAVTTNDATSITTNDATLNGTNGGSDADGHSFWVSTTPGFDVSSPTIPSGVYSTPDLLAISSSTPFSAQLSTTTTNGVPSNMPAITASTTYYYVAWTHPVGGEWTHGEILSFNTLPTPPVESATLVLVKHTIGGDATFNFNLTGSTSTSTAITTEGGYATTTITINVGTTTVSEQALAGWNLTSSHCVYDGEGVGSIIEGSEVISVDNGDTVTCTFTNTSNTVGSIKVIKNVVGPDGETDVADSTTFSVTLGGEITRSFGENASTTFEGLTAGLYTITEATSSDYDLVSISGDADSETPGVQIAVVAGLTNTVTITNKQHATSTPPASSTGNQSNGGGQTGGGNVMGWSAGAVLGASTDTNTSCKVLISSYMKRGANNDSEQVKKLQIFLNSQNLGVTITVNGIFDLSTENAVKLFQEKNTKDILTPWGLTKATRICVQDNTKMD